MNLRYTGVLLLLVENVILGRLVNRRRHSDDGANEEHVRGGQVLNWGSFRNIQSYNNKQLNIRKLYRGILF